MPEDILEGVSKNDGGLFAGNWQHSEAGIRYINYQSASNNVSLDGVFTIAELEAILAYIWTTKRVGEDEQETI